jgi:hypothetical protein
LLRFEAKLQFRVMQLTYNCNILIVPQRPI